MNRRLTRVSKYLTFVLRHEPHSIGLELDKDGFADIGALVAAANASGKSIKLEQVHEVIDQQTLPLFEISEDRQRMRAI